MGRSEQQKSETTAEEKGRSEVGKKKARPGDAPRQSSQESTRVVDVGKERRDHPRPTTPVQ